MSLSIDVSRKLLWPAVLSIVFIIARSNWWDSWGHDNSWVGLLVSPIIISFVAAIIVRLTAVGFRSEALEFLSRRRYDLISRSDAKQLSDSIEPLAESIKEITRMNRGPFGPLSRDYLLGAAALVVTILFTGPLGAILTRVLTMMP
ncbi:membrane protein [Rhodopirellula maiorica SM1]|uniref:Membrane protein n=2 Tax=Novipirellula TaxID=2795426 RepID=M5RUB6_9BACT|nr:membrane protein [Rhodopirellula maiorica SM1]